MSDPYAMMKSSSTKGFKMKTSTPDFLNDLYTCECNLFMCPICDSDFYVDMYREEQMSDFIPDDVEPPF
jgi:hypothetical protein